MRKLLVLSAALAVAILTGCAGFSSTVDLKQVAKQSGLTNITTGDGTFADYTAVTQVTTRDVGLAIGIPFVGKFQEVFPWRTNEELLFDAATNAKSAGATAMINTAPARELYLGFPFFFVGLYVDTATGTGIHVNPKR